MLHKIAVLVLSLGLSLNLYAQTQDSEAGVASLERAVGVPYCNRELKRCEYITRNITAQTLITRIRNNIFPGFGISPTEDGMINAESLQLVSFWFHQEELLQRIIQYIPLIDTFERFLPTALVDVQTDIFSVSEDAVDEINASVASILSNIVPGVDGAATGATVLNAIEGAMEIQQRINSTLLTSVLSLLRAKGKISKLTTVGRLVPNLRHIEFTHQTNVYVSSLAGIVNKETAGISIDGKVSISEEDRNLILIQDHSFRFGVMNPSTGTDNVQAPVTVLEVKTPELYLYKGQSRVVVSMAQTEQVQQRRFGFLSFGNTSKKMHSRLLIVTRARALSFEEWRQETQISALSQLHGKFGQHEISQFPKDPIQLETALKAIRPFAFDISGTYQRVLGFRLDRSFARLGNYDKKIDIEVKGPGVRYEGIRSVENLMTTGFRFGELPMSVWDKKYVVWTVTMKQFGQSEKVRIELYYNPTTNDFFTKDGSSFYTQN